jgi:uncharacterized membrane protein YsdA (DUF1294 family)/cold shock CspA family protein
MATSGRFFGTLTRWDDETSSGVLTTPDGSETFVHISEMPKGTRRPQPGGYYSFSRHRQAPLKRGEPARWDARWVRPDVVPQPAAARPSRAPRVRWQGVVVVLAIDAVVAAAFVPLLKDGLPIWLPAIYAVASLVAFLLYRSDKRRARFGGRRVSEATLQGWALIGGWPGALLAQQVFRHKTRKVSFQVGFWFVVILNVSALVLVVHLFGSA